MDFTRLITTYVVKNSQLIHFFVRIHIFNGNRMRKTNVKGSLCFYNFYHRTWTVTDTVDSVTNALDGSKYRRLQQNNYILASGKA